MNRTVLIVEDNLLNLEMAVELLEIAGFQTLEAENAERALEMARKHRPDLILMDLGLPGISGYDASRMIKSDPALKDMIIIGFTAMVSAEAQQKAMDVGFQGVIGKPIDVNMFADTVASFLRQKTHA